MGYEGVEIFDLHGHEPDEVASWLADTGLVACGRHATLDAVESQLPALAAEARALGWRRLVVGWVDPSAARAGLVRRLTAAAAAAATHGLELGFHNHDAEVRPRDGGASFLDELLAGDDVSSSSTSAGPGSPVLTRSPSSSAPAAGARSCT